MKAPGFALLDTVYFINNDEIKSGVIIEIKSEYILSACALVENIKISNEVMEKKKFLGIPFFTPKEIISNRTKVYPNYDYSESISNFTYVVFKGTIDSLNKLLNSEPWHNERCRKYLNTFYAGDSANINYAQLITGMKEWWEKDEINSKKNIIYLTEDKLFSEKSKVCECNEE